MAISFPSSPNPGDIYTYNGTKYVYDGVKWVSGGATTFLLKSGDTITGVINSSSTEAFGLPVGTTAQRPAGLSDGLVRYNTTLGRYEGYSDGSWGALGGGATGGGADRVFQTNTMVVTTDFTLPSGESALSAGPITINDGVSVTIPDNQNWVIF